MEDQGQNESGVRTKALGAKRFDSSLTSSLPTLWSITSNRAPVPRKSPKQRQRRRGLSRQCSPTHEKQNYVKSLFRGGDQEIIPCKGQWSSGYDAAFTRRRSEVRLLSDPLAPFLWSVKSNKTPTPIPTPFKEGM